jgi:hypothetical protein
MSAKSKLPPRRPQAERRHWVFVYRCGCPFGLVEESSNYKAEDDAWDAMYDTRAEERQARARGVRAEFVDHATYERDFYPRMTQKCTHGGAR